MSLFDSLRTRLPLEENRCRTKKVDWLDHIAWLNDPHYAYQDDGRTLTYKHTLFFIVPGLKSVSTLRRSAIVSKRFPGPFRPW